MTNRNHNGYIPLNNLRVYYAIKILFHSNMKLTGGNVKTIARQLNLSYKTTKKALSQLVRTGLVRTNVRPKLLLTEVGNLDLRRKPQKAKKDMWCCAVAFRKAPIKHVTFKYKVTIDDIRTHNGFKALVAALHANEFARAAKRQITAEEQARNPKCMRDVKRSQKNRTKKQNKVRKVQTLCGKYAGLTTRQLKNSGKVFMSNEILAKRIGCHKTTASKLRKLAGTLGLINQSMVKVQLGTVPNTFLKCHEELLPFAPVGRIILKKEKNSSKLVLCLPNLVETALDNKRKSRTTILKINGRTECRESSRKKWRDEKASQSQEANLKNIHATNLSNPPFIPLEFPKDFSLGFSLGLSLAFSEGLSEGFNPFFHTPQPLFSGCQNYN